MEAKPINSILHRKQKIIYTTIDVIDEYGIHDISTKEIAKRQKIAESTIFKHFPKKSNLLLEVLDHYSQYDQDIILSSRERIDNPKEAMLFFVKAYAEYYQNYPAITSITLSYDVLAHDNDLREKIEEIYYRRKDFIRELVMAAKAVEQLYAGLDENILTEIIFGSFTAVCLEWRFSKYSFSLKDRIMLTTETIFDAFGKYGK
ncbi:MAG: TetR/AcrR family transcriptional regulator [Peptococcaceae bacterium]|nr:TetR/AcrR family transcriptional regulator [Peptococcaceae bacterium]